MHHTGVIPQIVSEDIVGPAAEERMAQLQQDYQLVNQRIIEVLLENHNLRVQVEALQKNLERMEERKGSDGQN